MPATSIRTMVDLSTFSSNFRFVSVSAVISRVSVTRDMFVRGVEKAVVPVLAAGFVLVAFLLSINHTRTIRSYGS